MRSVFRLRILPTKETERRAGMQTLVNNVALLDANAERTRAASVRIEGTVIAAIRSEPFPASAQDRVLDGKGRLLLPGWVNAHAHLAMALFRGLGDTLPLAAWLEQVIWPRERDLTEEEVYWGTLLGLAGLVRSGITSVADMYFHVDAIGRAIEESGVRAVLSYGIVASELDARGKEELARAEDVVRCWEGHAGGRIRTSVGPHAPYTVGEDVWREAAALARRRDVLLHTHLAETAAEVATWRSRTGESPVVSLDRLGVFDGPTLAAHCVHVDARDIELLATRGVTVAHCPKSNAKLGSGIAPVRALHEAGVRVALGTDGAASDERLDFLEEIRFATLLSRAATEDPCAGDARGALAMATRAGAAGLGLNTGEIAVGREADLILLDLDEVEMGPDADPASAVVYGAGRESVRDVLVAGEFVLREGELVTIDEERVRSEVRRLGRRCRN